MVLIDILIRTTETKIVASDTLPRLIIIGNLASWIWLSHIVANSNGMKRKRKKENHDCCGFILTFEPCPTTPLDNHTT